MAGRPRSLRAFGALTLAGQTRRLRPVVVAALHEFGIRGARIRFLAFDSNTSFRVDTVDGQRFVLRISIPDGHTRDHNEAELWFLDRLRERTDVLIVECVRTADGRGVVEIGVDGVPEVRRCSLFRWIPGSVIDERETVEQMELLGSMAAWLHATSGDLVPEQQLQRWDRTFYWDEPVVVFDQPDPLTETDVDMLRAVSAHIDASITELHRRHPPFLVHGDLHGGNVMESRGKLTIFDFEDLLWANAAQDLSVALYGPRFYTSTYPALRDGLRRGYELHAPWPIDDDATLEVLFHARAAMFVNYCTRAGGDLVNVAPTLLTRLHAYARTIGSDAP